ncbi:MAG TPA: hypothetical protein PKX15_00355 [Bacteroidales bacterium]|nr:hypothetical protein [Bacteroidales bacterium]
MKVNLTPHVIKTTDGKEYPPSGAVARVESRHALYNIDGDGDEIFRVKYGTVTNLPPRKEGTTYIVSAMVLSALKGMREDVVAPATSHPDVKRDSKGQIETVPGFVIYD